MQRFQTGKVVACNVVVWGILSMVSASIQNFAGLAICRFLLGFFESLTFPGFSIIISQWWTRPEQTVRVAVIYNVASTLFNGLISCERHRIARMLMRRWVFIHQPRRDTAMESSLHYRRGCHFPPGCHHAGAPAERADDGLVAYASTTMHRHHASAGQPNGNLKQDV